MAELDKQAWIIRSIFDEVIEEINDRTADNRETADALLSMMFAKCGQMMQWVATGDIPEDMQDDNFATKIFGQLAIESANAGNT